VRISPYYDTEIYDRNTEPCNTAKYGDLPSYTAEYGPYTDVVKLVLGIHEQNEELSSSSTTPEDPIDYESDTNLCSMMSDDDHERNSYQPAQDPATDNAQSFLPDARQISIALALFRHRHSLSKSCINDLCELLRYLGVKGVPTDFRSIERNILQN
ncbi:unnamed protein product, partial [Rotaria socialis]